MLCETQLPLEAESPVEVASFYRSASRTEKSPVRRVGTKGSRTERTPTTKAKCRCLKLEKNFPYVLVIWYVVSSRQKHTERPVEAASSQPPQEGHWYQSRIRQPSVSTGLHLFQSEETLRFSIVRQPAEWYGHQRKKNFYVRSTQD